jgi:methionyl-tRNA formyltransferase
MKIIFMGTPDFAVPSLKALLSSMHTVVCAVTAPDKPAGRGLDVQSSAVKKIALQFDLPLLQPEKLDDEILIRKLQDFRADLFVVVAFRILPPAVFKIPPLGTLNLHASLLPKYRGAAPIQWALIQGEQETGVTTFFIDEKVDTGEIILQRTVTVPPEMNSGELHDVLSAIGAEVLLETVAAIEKGNCPRVKQAGPVSLAPKINKELCRIHWDKNAVDIHNFVRGLSPVPGAMTEMHHKILKILATRTTAIPDSAVPGTIIRVDKNGPFYVQTGHGVLSILKVQPEGKRTLTSAEYLRGYPIHVNDKFIEIS